MGKKESFESWKQGFIEREAEFSENAAQEKGAHYESVRKAHLAELRGADSKARTTAELNEVGRKIAKTPELHVGKLDLMAICRMFEHIKPENITATHSDNELVFDITYPEESDALDIGELLESNGYTIARSGRNLRFSAPFKQDVVKEVAKKYPWLK